MSENDRQLFDLRKKIETYELNELQKQLETYDFRTRILLFQSKAVRLNSRCRFLLTDKGEFHLNECFWSLKNATRGSQACHCRSKLDSPDSFFEKRMLARSNHVSILHLVKPRNSNAMYYKPLDLCQDENLNDFYMFRVSDSENVFKWYEMYRVKTNILRFRVKVRELKKKDLIDAVYNTDSGEWHLTDCIKCVKWDNGPDTCHCQSAIMNPWKYLKDVYDFVDSEKLVEKIRNEKVPVNFKTSL